MILSLGHDVVTIGVDPTRNTRLNSLNVIGRALEECMGNLEEIIFTLRIAYTLPLPSWFHTEPLEILLYCPIRDQEREVRNLVSVENLDEPHRSRHHQRP